MGNNRHEKTKLALYPGNYRSEKEKEVFEYMANNIDELETEYYEKYGDILSLYFEDSPTLSRKEKLRYGLLLFFIIFFASV